MSVGDGVFLKLFFLSRSIVPHSLENGGTRIWNAAVERKLERGGTRLPLSQ
jgi:hypothetical protein